ncbi:TetR family transcriptional regulator [Streptomyces sp. NPDC047072]|uniref:TetR/AcrR family transcriptional regulator n=1 Tax=Streptomyces sp. NPDC047072 TaxID=3154809 RepID=UPI0033E5E876
MTEVLGRRERKKAQTRKALADAALKLFTEHGFDNVGVRDVAEEADVAVTTLFKHFPSKEALVFDDDAGEEARLVAAVRDREPGQSVLHALRDYLQRGQAALSDQASEFANFMQLINSTPSLQEYMHRMWRRHETALAAAIAESTGASEGDIRVAALARFVIEAGTLVNGYEDPERALHEVFDLLEHGWETGSS